MGKRHVWTGIPRPFDSTVEVDYQAAYRRDRCSRKDFGSGYRALAMRMLNTARDEVLTNLFEGDTVLPAAGTGSTRKSRR